MRAEAFQRLFPPLAGIRNAKGVMIAADHAAHLLGRTVEDTVKDGSLLAEGLIIAQRLYQSDFAIVFLDTALEAEALGARLEFCDDKSPEVIEPLSFDELRFKDITDLGRVPEIFKTAEICQREFGDSLRLFFSLKDPFSLAGRALDTSEFLEATLSAPTRVREILSICVEVQRTYLKAILASGFAPLIGAPVASGDLISPAHFREFAEPCLQTLFEQISAAGQPRSIHICGDTSRFGASLARLMPDLFSFEQWSPAVWEMLPDTVPMGYVPTPLFAHGTVELVQEAALNCASNLPAPYVLCSACDIPPNALVELVQAMMGTKHEEH